MQRSSLTKTKNSGTPKCNRSRGNRKCSFAEKQTNLDSDNKGLRTELKRVYIYIYIHTYTAQKIKGTLK